VLERFGEMVALLDLAELRGEVSQARGLRASDS
jgi:hypothetical protein